MSDDSNSPDDGTTYKVPRDALKKSHKAAVTLIPPENVWSQIQAIRK